MNECCFCESALDPADTESLAMVVTAAARVGDDRAPSQQLWCHAECLSQRLRPKVPFEPTAFDD